MGDLSHVDYGEQVLRGVHCPIHDIGFGFGHIPRDKKRAGGRYSGLCGARDKERELKGVFVVTGLLVEAARVPAGGINDPRPAELALLEDVVRMHRHFLVLKSTALEVRRVLTETLQFLGYRQSAGLAVDHAVLGKLDPVLEREIGMDKVCKGATDLIMY